MNKLEENSIYQLLDIMEKSKSILELSITQEFNIYSTNTLKKLCNAVKNNKSLRRLVFDIELSKDNV